MIFFRETRENMMLGADVRRVFETILPDKVLGKLVLKSKLQERARKLDALRLLRAMVIAAATGYGGRQADVMRLYFESGAARVVRGVFMHVLLAVATIILRSRRNEFTSDLAR